MRRGVSIRVRSGYYVEVELILELLVPGGIGRTLRYNDEIEKYDR